VDTQADDENCGICGKVCNGAFQQCVAGKCKNVM
jgi:hypothetical protein